MQLVQDLVFETRRAIGNNIFGRHSLHPEMDAVRHGVRPYRMYQLIVAKCLRRSLGSGLFGATVVTKENDAPALQFRTEGGEGHHYCNDFL